MHVIEKAVGETNWLVRRIRCCYALGLILIVTVLAFLLLAGFDYWLRPGGVSQRLAALATACARRRLGHLAIAPFAFSQG